MAATDISLPQATATSKTNTVLFIILPLAMLVAIAGPFDLAIQFATRGSPVARLVLIAAVVLTGAACANQSGLSLQARSRQWLWIALGSALAVAAYVCIVDVWLFRSVAPPDYLHVMQFEPLKRRMTYYVLRAFQENVIYRMFVFSALTLAVTQWKRIAAAELSTTLVWTIAFATQIINVTINVIAPEQVSLALYGYDFVRYVIPGALWGWLYWRYGFVTTEVAHVACHFFLQPALGNLL